MEEDNALSTGMAAWCAGDRVGDPVSDLSLITERKSARDVTRDARDGRVVVSLDRDAIRAGKAEIRVDAGYFLGMQGRRSKQRNERRHERQGEESAFHRNPSGNEELKKASYCNDAFVQST